MSIQIDPYTRQSERQRLMRLYNRLQDDIAKNRAMGNAEQARLLEFDAQQAKMKLQELA